MPVIPAARARQLFAAARVARLATVSAEGRPHLVPCTFAVDGDAIYIAVDHKPKTTTRLRRLANIEANPSVSLLADHYDDDWAALWWVRADGRATVIAEQTAMAGPLSLLAQRYSQYVDQRPAGPVIDVRVTRWSGWTATAGPATGQRPPGSPPSR